jgi:hypothetical protein
MSKGRAAERECQCEACLTDGIHASDCAVHNAPALPVGRCDCRQQDDAVVLAGIVERLARAKSTELTVTVDLSCDLQPKADTLVTVEGPYEIINELVSGFPTALDALLRIIERQQSALAAATAALGEAEMRERAWKSVVEEIDVGLEILDMAHYPDGTSGVLDYRLMCGPWHRLLGLARGVDASKAKRGGGNG